MPARTPLIAAVVIAALLANVGCDTPTARDVIPKDDWLTPWPIRPEESDSALPAVAGRDVLHVHPEQTAQAMKILEARPFVQLSLEDAASLLGEKHEAKGRGVYYLVRSLKSGDLTGGYQLRLKGDSLWVHFGILSRRVPKFRRQPLVVFLPRDIDRLFVTVSVAQ